MAEEKRSMPHSLIVENRKTVIATGVSNVDSFDEQVIVAYTDFGELIIRGKNLQINKLSVETGEMSISGEIISMSYTEPQPTGSILARIFR